MNDRHDLPLVISYATAVLFCAVVIGGMFGFFFVIGSASLAFLMLIVGAVAWGVGARTLQIPSGALPIIALAVELVIAFEFKRIYILDYAGGPPPRSIGVLMDNLLISDLVIGAVLVGFGLLGWQWKRRTANASI